VFLLETFAAAPMPRERATERGPALAAVVEHLRREWADLPLRPIGIEELAGVAGVSRSYLARRSRHELGMSPTSALELLRCARAETLLTRTDLPVGTIARHCGFADPFHFSHRFALRYGMSPSAYRAADRAAPSVFDDPSVRRLASEIWVERS
jgi:AraC-like DNA-binding protein